MKALHSLRNKVLPVAIMLYAYEFRRNGIHHQLRLRIAFLINGIPLRKLHYKNANYLVMVHQ